MPKSLVRSSQGFVIARQSSDSHPKLRRAGAPLDLPAPALGHETAHRFGLLGNLHRYGGPSDSPTSQRPVESCRRRPNRHN